MIIYIKNLECYKNAPNEKKEKIHSNRGFDLDRYPNRSIQEEMKKYVEFKQEKENGGENIEKDSYGKRWVCFDFNYFLYSWNRMYDNTIYIPTGTRYHRGHHISCLWNC